MALLQLHVRMEEEIKAYDGDVKAVNAQGQKLIKSGISSLNVSFSLPSGLGVFFIFDI